MRPEEIEELNGPQRELAGELYNRIKRENLSHEFSGKRKLMFLSGPDDSDTVKLSGPIANDKRGKNGNLTPFTYGHRYADLESLKKAHRTSELEQ